MCVKKVACGLQKVVKEDGREILEPIFVEVDCPEDMHRVSGKIDSCKTVTPKIVEENVQEVEVLPVTVQNEHDTHGGHGGATAIGSPNGIGSPTANNNDSPIDNNDSPITVNDSPIDNIGSPTNSNGSPTNSNGSPREIVCIETGEVFANATQAGKSTGIARQHINACCNGKRKSAGGRHWQYL